MSIIFYDFKAFLKGIMCKGAISIPLFFMIRLFLMPAAIYIPQIGLYVSSSITFIIFTVFTVLWLCYAPHRTNCCDGSWFEMMFYLFPANILLLFIFVQYHFWISVSIVTGILSFQIVFSWSLKKDIGQKKLSAKERMKHKVMRRRFFVLNAFALLAVPCFISLFIYDAQPPSYEARQEIHEDFFGANNNVDIDTEDLFSQNRKLFSYFQQETWQTFTVEEKVTILQQLADFEAERLSVPSCAIRAEKLNMYTLGSFNWETGELLIDLQHLEEDPSEECIKTICHEVFHVFEHYVVSNVDWSSTLSQTAYFDDARMWRDNASDYKTGYIEGYEVYSQQPLEASAFAYGEEETALIISFCGDSNSLPKE